MTCCYEDDKLKKFSVFVLRSNTRVQFQHVLPNLIELHDSFDTS